MTATIYASLQTLVLPLYLGLAPCFRFESRKGFQIFVRFCLIFVSRIALAVAIRYSYLTQCHARRSKTRHPGYAIWPLYSIGFDSWVIWLKGIKFRVTTSLGKIWMCIAFVSSVGRYSSRTRWTFLKKSQENLCARCAREALLLDSPRNNMKWDEKWCFGGPRYPSRCTVSTKILCTHANLRMDNHMVSLNFPEIVCVTCINHTKPAFSVVGPAGQPSA